VQGSALEADWEIVVLERAPAWDQAGGLEPQAARAGAAGVWEVQRVLQESEAGQGGALGLAVVSEKGQALAAGCLEVRMTNRSIESCGRWRRLGALERARIQPRPRWNFRIRCRNCLARRRRR